jgi:glucose/arabinose dehydrogenase
LEKQIHANFLRTGLRNPNGLAWRGGRLWTVSERARRASAAISCPDYLTSVADGGFYGWPYSYYGPNVDKRVTPQRPDLVGKAIKPDYALGSHVAPLGPRHDERRRVRRPSTARGTAGRRRATTWCSSPFKDGKPSGSPVEVLNGFLSPEGNAWGRRSASRSTRRRPAGRRRRRQRSLAAAPLGRRFPEGRHRAAARIEERQPVAVDR